MVPGMGGDFFAKEHQRAETQPGAPPLNDRSTIILRSNYESSLLFQAWCVRNNFRLSCTHW